MYSNEFFQQKLTLFLLESKRVQEFFVHCSFWDSDARRKHEDDLEQFDYK